MPAPLRRLVAACLCLGSLAVPLEASPAAAQPSGTPLDVTIASVSPASVTSSTQRGRLVVRGEVQNTSKQDWSALAAYLVVDTQPLQTPADLSSALSNDQSALPGTQLDAPGQFTALPDLAAGGSESYRLAVPISRLGLSGPGVYRIGVEILGSNAQGAELQTAARAQTFLPLMKPGAAKASVSIVVPIRARVGRSVDGSVLNQAGWISSVGPGGRLANVVSFAEQGLLPVSLLVDPAVLDAVGSIADGNPANGEKGTPGAVTVASEWLQMVSAVGHASRVLSLPYGDTDAGAAVTQDQTTILSTAEQRSQSILSGYPVTPLIAPQSGTLTPAQLRALKSGVHILLEHKALPNASSSAVNIRSGSTVTLADGTLSSVPTQGASLIPLRQALLSELALRSLTGVGREPIVFSFPPHWRAPSPDQSQLFFSGLTQPWVRGVDFPIAGGGDPTVADAKFQVPKEAPASVPIGNFVVAGQLLQSSRALAELVSDPALIDSGERQALLAVSENFTGRPGPVASRTSGALAVLNGQLRKVSLSGPSFVTMSSGTGSFQVTISNKLDQDVVVGLDAVTSSTDLTVKSVAPVTVSAGQQRSVRVTVTSHHLGVFRVTLHPVTANGTALPTSLILSVRGSQIGQVIWVIIGLAGALLFSTIAMRTVRRIRGRRG